MKADCLLIVSFAYVLAACSEGPSGNAGWSAPVTPQVASAPTPLAFNGAVPATKPLELSADWVRPIATPEVDFEWDNWWWAPSRYSETVYTWQDWRLVDISDREHGFSHVRVEFKGVLQYLTVGTGYGMSFFDSEDWRTDLCGEQSEVSLPPADSAAPTWLVAGKPSKLLVEDLTQTGGCTLVLLDWTGGMHVYRQVTFLHLCEDGRVKSFGPYQTGMNVARAERAGDDTHFVLSDNWTGWGCCMAGSASPEVRLSMKGGELHSCNGMWDDAAVAESLATVERLKAEQDADNNYDNHYEYFARNLVLDLIYHGRVEAAREFVMTFAGSIGEMPPLEDDAKRRSWWRSVLIRVNESTLGDVLEREFPQIERAYYAED